MQKPPITAFTTSSNEHKNVLINEVQVAAAYKPSVYYPSPIFKTYNGIWDTGATQTAITKRAVNDCALKPISMCQVKGVNQTRLANVYLINARLQNKVEFVELRAIEVDELLGKNVDLLIGMDIIGEGDFAVSNYQGKTTFTFQMPSQAKIDFVKKIHMDSITKGKRLRKKRPKSRKR